MPSVARADSGDAICGSVITQSVTLHHNASCSGDGLVVTAGGVTIDLGGYRLKGAATGTGILVATDGTGGAVVVTNGTVTGFDKDIVASASSTTLTGVTVTRAVTNGLTAEGPATVVISNSKLTNNATAVFAARTGGVALKVTTSKFTGNGIGIVLGGPNHAIIANNTFTANTTGVTAFQSDGHTISGNRFSQNVKPIDLSQSRNNMIKGNRVANNTNGLQIVGTESQGNTITANDFVGNGSYGARIGDGSVNSVDRTTISDNNFRFNGASGLWFVGAPAPNGPNIADGSNITSNRLVGNGFSPGDLVDENGDALIDGLHVFNPAGSNPVTLTGNCANFNAGWGINAALVIDGGGNTAFGNGKTAGGGGPSSCGCGGRGDQTNEA
jgi:parallel beta-helix repeat protein